MNRLTDVLKECDGISENIMNDVYEELNKNKIEYEVISKSECVIKGKSKSDINKILSNIDATSEQIKILLQVSEVDGTTFIRQKIK